MLGHGRMHLVRLDPCGFIVVFNWCDQIRAGSSSDAPGKIGSMLGYCRVQLVGLDPCWVIVGCTW